MGKDVRGIERGKCACGEWEDFMRSDGATCGYCGCLPTRHSKKDARYSSDSVDSTSGARTSESPEKWKDEDLGWFPNPKGEYTEFSNSILPKFYLSFWTTCPYKERFRCCFVTERKRQWEVREALKAINHKLAFVTSDNPAAAGRFMEENFSAKRHDATTIKNNIDDLVKLKVKIDELNAKVTEEDNALFNSNGRHIKSGHKFSHDTNEEFLESLKIIKKTVGETMELLEKARDKVASIFPLKQGNALKRKSRMQKQNRHKSEKRRRLRYKENEEAIKRKILHIQLSSLRVDELSLYFSHHKITFKGKKAEKVAMIKAHIGNLLYNSMERQQLRQPPLRNVHQQETSSLSEMETDSQSDIIDRVVGSSPSSSSNESSTETDFIPEPDAETLPTSKYGRKRARVERDNYVSWDKIVF